MSTPGTEYKVWSDDIGCDKEDAETIKATCPDNAAEIWLELNYSAMSYPSSCVVDVQDSEGKHSLWEVTVESVPAFHASKYEHPKPIGGDT